MQFWIHKIYKTKFNIEKTWATKSTHGRLPPTVRWILENRIDGTYIHIFMLGSKLVKITSCSIFVGIVSAL